MDSETSSCCCFLLRLLFLVQKTAHARGAVREPTGWHIVRTSPLFAYWGGTLFLKRFLEPFVSLKITIWERKWLSKWGRNYTWLKLFSKKRVKTKKCVSTSRARTDCMRAHPMERPGPPKNQIKNMPYFKTYFLVNKISRWIKKGCQKVSKWVTLFRGWRLFGGSWATFCALSRFLIPTMSPQRPQIAYKDQKILWEWTPRYRKWPRPGGLREALSINFGDPS